MTPTPEVRLELAQFMLAAAKEQLSPPEMILFWEEAVRECEAELTEKPK